MSGALADLDFGPVIRAVRIQTGWSQQTLGTYLGMTQTRISNIENGKRSITDLRTGIRVINLLMVPAASVGLLHGITVRSTTERRGWMERRDFIEQVAVLAWGSGAAGVSEQLDLDRLAALLHPESQGARSLGEADVTALEQANAHYETLVHRFGGGYAREVAAAHLRATLPLLTTEVVPELRARLHTATAHLALLTGWMHFDGLLHEPARRMWLAGLRIAKGADDPITTDLTGHLLFVLAQQALEVARPQEALQLVRIGQTVAERPSTVSPSTSTTLLINLAFAHAARGDRQGCARALGEAEEAFSGIDLAATAPWACVDGAVKLTTWQGHAYYELGRASGDQGSLTRALPALTAATDNPRAMSRALYLPDLAGTHALTGDIDITVTLGHQAIDMITSMHSRRAYQRLKVLRGVLEPMSASPGVTELRDRLASTTAT